MAIVEDYGAIAKRMRELRCQTAGNAGEITQIEKWGEAALEIARAYAQKRKRELAFKKVLHRVPLPTD